MCVLDVLYEVQPEGVQLKDLCPVSVVEMEARIKSWQQENVFEISRDFLYGLIDRQIIGCTYKATQIDGYTFSHPSIGEVYTSIAVAVANII